MDWPTLHWCYSNFTIMDNVSSHKIKSKSKQIGIDLMRHYVHWFENNDTVPAATKARQLCKVFHIPTLATLAENGENPVVQLLPGTGESLVSFCFSSWLQQDGEFLLLI